MGNLLSGGCSWHHLAGLQTLQGIQPLDLGKTCVLSAKDHQAPLQSCKAIRWIFMRKADNPPHNLNQDEMSSTATAAAEEAPAIRPVNMAAWCKAWLDM